MVLLAEHHGMVVDHGPRETVMVVVVTTVTRNVTRDHVTGHGQQGSDGEELMEHLWNGYVVSSFNRRTGAT